LLMKNSINTEIKAFLKRSLPKEKYLHVLRVSKTAAGLARRHHLPEKKARLAGLLHDAGKNMKAPEVKPLLSHIRYTAEERKIPALWHAKAGEEVARRVFKVKDRSVLHAIGNHVTGSSLMDGLSKVVFLADKIEPGRSYRGVKELRALSQKDLDAAMVLALANNFTYVGRKGKKLHPLSVKVLESFVKKCSS